MERWKAVPVGVVIACPPVERKSPWKGGGRGAHRQGKHSAPRAAVAASRVENVEWSIRRGVRARVGTAPACAARLFAREEVLRRTAYRPKRLSGMACLVVPEPAAPPVR